jgi:hypothetical protein
MAHEHTSATIHKGAKQTITTTSTEITITVTQQRKQKMYIKGSKKSTAASHERANRHNEAISNITTGHCPYTYTTTDIAASHAIVSNFVSINANEQSSSAKACPMRSRISAREAIRCTLSFPPHMLPDKFRPPQLPHHHPTKMRILRTTKMRLLEI